MSHQDSKVRLNAVCLKQSLHWLLEGVDWSTVKFRDDCSCTPRMLSWAALLWAWSDELTLRDRLESVRRIIQFLCPRQGNLATSYQAFIKLQRRWERMGNPPVGLNSSNAGTRTWACRLTAGAVPSAASTSRTVTRESRTGSPGPLRWDHAPMADRDDFTASFLAMVDEAFGRLMDEPDAHLHVAGFAEGDVAFVLTTDGLEVRRRAEVYGSEN